MKETKETGTGRVYVRDLSLLGTGPPDPVKARSFAGLDLARTAPHPARLAPARPDGSKDCQVNYCSPNPSPRRHPPRADSEKDSDAMESHSPSARGGWGLSQKGRSYSLIFASIRASRMGATRGVGNSGSSHHCGSLSRKDIHSFRPLRNSGVAPAAPIAA